MNIVVPSLYYRCQSEQHCILGFYNTCDAEQQMAGKNCCKIVHININMCINFSDWHTELASISKCQEILFASGAKYYDIVMSRCKECLCDL